MPVGRRRNRRNYDVEKLAKIVEKVGISYGLLESVRTQKLIGIKGSPYKLSKFVRIPTSAVPVARKCVASGLDFGDFVEKWG